MNRVTHFEIPANDPDLSMNFYKEIFAWNFFQYGNEQYWLANTGEETDPGINGAIIKKRHPDQPITNSIKVGDIDLVMQKITAAGGTIVVPKTPIPGAGWFSFFKDPDNNIMGLMQEDKTAK